MFILFEFELKRMTDGKEKAKHYIDVKKIKIEEKHAHGEEITYSERIWAPTVLAKSDGLKKLP